MAHPAAMFGRSVSNNIVALGMPAPTVQYELELDGMRHVADLFGAASLTHSSFLCILTKL
jgi:hypothetical protein